MNNTQVAQLFLRLKQTQEGLDFIEYLKELSTKNFDAFKRCDTEMNNIIKGKALVYDELIKAFEKCADKLEHNDTQEVNAFN